MACLVLFIHSFADKAALFFKKFKTGTSASNAIERYRNLSVLMDAWRLALRRNLSESFLWYTRQLWFERAKTSLEHQQQFPGMLLKIAQSKPRELEDLSKKR